MPAAPPDSWPVAASHRYLDGARLADLAWEWLRRHPDYRSAACDRAVPLASLATTVAAAPAGCTARWGCLSLPHPDSSWRDAPILWSAAVDPSVLRVVALPPATNAQPTFDLRNCAASVSLIRGRECEHVLLRQGAEFLRLDVIGGSLLDGPVMLLHDLAGMKEIEPAITALRRFLHLCRAGQLPSWPQTTRQHLRRQIRALRVHDARAAGASIRDVGVMLFGVERVRSEWLGEALKSQCRRLIALAHAMVAGGYRSLLG